MKLPCEVCMWKLVPLIKKRLVLNLYNDKKIKQIEITKMLNMSKASVSHYIKGKRGGIHSTSDKKAALIMDSMAKKLVKGASYKNLKDDFCKICKILQKEVLHDKIC